MIKLKEVYKCIDPRNPARRYRVREVFINPNHIKYIRETPPQLIGITEGSTIQGLDPSNREFCTLMMDGPEMWIVGSIKEIEKKILNGKVLLNG